MQWFKLMADLQGHPKRWRFEELAETEYGLHYLTAWFSYVCKFAPDGDISKFTKREVARACEWKGDPETLWAALQGAGFIDQTETGFVAHDWEEHNGRFIKENAKRKEPKGYPRVTQGLPTLQDSTVQDIQDKTRPKTIPPDGGEGFQRFWALYSKKSTKAESLEYWRKLAPSAELQAKIFKALEQENKLRAKAKTTGTFFAEPLDPIRWLKRERWEDEILAKPRTPYSELSEESRKLISRKEWEAQ